MSFDFKLIACKEELKPYKADILGLFQASFNKELPGELWDWAYVQNPYQDPVVSLCFNEDNLLVGHYAIIPFKLSNAQGSILAGLSMTTMVLESYRKNGLFVEQASRVYEKAAQLGFRVVIGFPNKNSAPGFKKRLGWEIQEDYVVSVTAEQLAADQGFRQYAMNPQAYGFDLSDEAFKLWRLSKPGARYQDHGALIDKVFDQAKDIVYSQAGYEQCLEKEQTYNVLIDEAVGSFKENQVFDYPFGYRVLQGEPIKLFKKDLLLSDVF